MIGICKQCGKSFDAECYWQKFCNIECRHKYHSENQVVKKTKTKKIIKHRFPKLVCEVCNRVIKLDFFPLERKVWGIVCKCGKHYD